MNVCRRLTVVSCYCDNCQQDRLAPHVLKFPDTIEMEIEAAKKREENALDVTFNEVLNQVALYKAFKEQVYNIFRYKNVACYYKYIKGYDAAQAKQVAEKINGGANIFDRFQEILDNLKPCPFIDIHKLSVNQLILAFNYKWCLMHNEVLRNRIGCAKADDFVPSYSEDDFQDFVRVIRAHPVYQSLDRSRENNYGRKEITALMHRAQKTLL